MTSAPHFPGFNIQRFLGRGNSANVYLALDGNGRRVALKIPFPETLQDPSQAERFANEVRLSLQLKHEHLVVGYAGAPFGEDSHLAMRYFPEGTLTRWLDLGKLSHAEALRILADIAAALTFLHAQGVVHQDVKSQNVYLDAGRAALGDLGAAYFVTQGGKTAGSPFYMAPEIYRTEGSSAASDVYSFGVLAYEMLANERPFTGRSYEELMAAHLSRYPKPLANLVPELPRPLLHLIERTLAKAAADRPSALVLLRALEGALGVEESQLDEPQAASAAPAKAVPPGRHAPRTTPDAPAGNPGAKAPPGENPPGRAGFWNPFRKRPAR